MFRRFFQNLRQRKPSRQNTPRWKHRLRLGAFEDRVLLSTFSWAADVSGDFNAASNWNGPNNTHAVPGPGDDASIGWGDITVTVSGSTSVQNLNSAATLDLTAGSLSLSNSPDQQYGSQLAELNMADGTTLNLAAGSAGSSYKYSIRSALSSQSQLSGTVNIGANASLDLGNFNLTGTLNASLGANVTLQGRTMQVSGGSLAGGGLYTVAGSAYYGPELKLNNDVTVQNLDVDGNNIIDGTGNINVGTSTSPGNFTFIGGTLKSTGTITVPVGATFTANPNPGPDLEMNLDNFGSFYLEAGLFSPWLVIGEAVPGATLTNEPGGVIQLSNGAQIDSLPGSVGGQLVNLGTICADAGSGGIAQLYCPLNNQGTIVVQAGSTLQLGNQVTSTNALFQVDTGSVLELNYQTSGPVTLFSGTKIQGAGYADLVNGRLDVAGAVTVDNF
ncbi:MAG TPA: hypothetical protein VFA18_13500, partial [Gemmataceae bacterium]|nr:hypothetical protein [Gemmataceae bacterium]